MTAANTRGRPRRTSHRPAVVWVLLAGLLTSLLTPARPGRAQPSQEAAPEREVVFVLDASRSVTPVEWRAITRGVDVTLRRRDHLPLGVSAVSVVVFTGPGAVGSEVPLVQEIVSNRLLDTEDDAAEIGAVVRGHAQTEGSTPVTAGLRGAAEAVSHGGAATETTVCLLTDGIENVEGETVPSVDFLVDAGADRFSVVAAEDSRHSVEELAAEYGPLVFGGGGFTATTNRGVIPSSVADGCFTPSIDVEGIEVNQGVQNLANDAALVAGKRAMVRVTGHAGAGISEWTGRLELREADGTLIREYGPAGGSASNLGPDASLAELRAAALEFHVLATDLRDGRQVTVRFVPASGQVSCLDIDADCEVTLTPQRFEREIVFIGTDVVRQTDAGEEVVFEADPREASAAAAVLAAWARRGLPFDLRRWSYVESARSYDATEYLDARDAARTAAVDAVAMGLVDDPADDEDEFDQFVQARRDGQVDAHRDLLGDILALTIEQQWRVTEDPESTVVYGLFDIPGIGGRANGFDAATSAGAAFQTRLVHLHEIGHSLGLPHAATAEDGERFADPCGAVAADQWPDTVTIDGRDVAALGPDGDGAGFWGHTGSSPGTAIRGVMPRSTMPNLMGYCGAPDRAFAPTQWLGGAQWNRIVGEDVELRVDFGDSIAITPGRDGDALEVADLRPRPTAVAAPSDPTHRIDIIRDGEPEPIAQLDVDLRGEPGVPLLFDDGTLGPASDPESVSQDPIAVGLPTSLREGAAHTIQVVNLADSAVVSEVAVSPSRPQIEITTDVSGQVTGPLNLTWEATDDDGDALSYDVLVRPEDVWIPVAAGITANQLDLDLSSFTWTDAVVRVRVVASDGIRTDADLITLDYVSSDQPWVAGTIVDPVDSSTYTYGEIIPLSAESTSNAPTHRVEWASDVDGRILQSDGVAAADLSPGEHVISLYGVAGRDDQEVRQLLDRASITVQTAPVPEQSVVLQRTAGNDRYQTAASISRLQWPAGAQHVFVASGENFPDALTAGPAAAAVGAPILLAGRTALPSATAAELERLQPRRVTVIGGAAVIEDPVIEEIREAAPDAFVDRVFGSNRFATAAALADRFLPSADRIYLATGADFPDALTGGAVAGWRGSPILLTNSDSIPAELTAYLDGRTVTVELLGGTAAISEDVAAALADEPGVDSVVRRAGENRFATAAVAMEPFGRSVSAFVATGRAFPDGLAIAPVAALTGTPVLLTEPDVLPADTIRALQELGVTQVRIIGGERAVTADVAAELRATLDAIAER
ncbi:cell wall-binding repeat-containing protein [Euzebya tangerina]|uniref:cell wall-binding repeat-containing protein n=1 Tax=Euzebya tangerina TaxID=591198 RepID=UPI000E3167D2|nr:cell wall-binding repeat-containing protein [Euzebya tangerina]